MGKVRMAGGGGGADLDQITATGPDILSGKIGVDKEGNPLPGTMPNQGKLQMATSITLYKEPATNITSLYFRTKEGYYGKRSFDDDPNAAAEVYAEQSKVAEKAGLTAAKLLAGQNVLGVAGTATNDATAGSSQILSGYTAYRNGVKVTGTVAVQSILSFSAATYSSVAISFSWKNPAKGAFSGIIIVGKTGSYPTNINDGTRYYKGAGNNTAANGTSTATVSSFAGGNTYYFRAFSYAIKDGSEWIHATSYTATAATTKGQVIVTSSGSWTVPAGVRSVDVFCVGGGASGKAALSVSSSSTAQSGGGGGSGKTATLLSYAVTPGQVFATVIGAGGVGAAGITGSMQVYNPNNAGGTTSFGSILSATGGESETSESRRTFGTTGGSAGGSSGYRSESNNGGRGGSDGGPGYNGYGNVQTTGQGTTTRAFGESSGTLYGDGAGAGAAGSNTYSGGASGSGIGGHGASASSPSTAGTANTGSGGGGAYANSVYLNSSAGGSGVIIVRWGY